MAEQYPSTSGIRCDITQNNMHHITLYTKHGCHLCDGVLEDLRLIGYEMDLIVETVDITSTPALFERFQNLIPVVDVEGGPLLTPPITIRRLRDALAEVHSPSDTGPLGRP
jgi:hypothetical protein